MQQSSKIKTIFNLLPKSRINNNQIVENVYCLLQYRESILILVSKCQPLAQFQGDSILLFKLNLL